MQPNEQGAEEAEAQAHSESYPAQWDGVAGWLGFLVASLIVLGPVVTVIGTALEFSQTERLYPEVVGTSLWRTAQTITWGSVAAYCLVSIYAGARLLRKHVPSSVTISIVCLWIAGPLVAIVGLIALGNAGAEPTASDVGAALGRPIIWSTAWTLYLLYSRRVRDTYFGGRSISALTGDRWRSTGKRNRQLVFFSACWLVLSFAYFQVIAPLDLYPEDGEVQRMWAIVLLPPILLSLGSWAYARVVGDD